MNDQTEYEIPAFLRKQVLISDLPMLFNAPMVRAILDGSKTQTRRIVKGQEYWGSYIARVHQLEPSLFRMEGSEQIRKEVFGNDRTFVDVRCPYGQPSDQLWVRENGWERPERTSKMMREGADTWAPYYFDADGWSEQDFADFKAWGFKRRPSIHMPRKASRIQLEITGIRVERLQDISEEDAVAEGWPLDDTDPKQWYAALWESINGDGSWEANPFVWVVEFRRLKP